MQQLWIVDPATIAKGGPGSGFHGHAGRPGEVGGSAPADSMPTTVLGKATKKPTTTEIMRALQEIARDEGDERTVAILEKMINQGGDQTSLLPSMQSWPGYAPNYIYQLPAEQFFAIDDLTDKNLLAWSTRNPEQIADAWDRLDNIKPPRSNTILGLALNTIAGSPKDVPAWVVEKYMVPADLGRVLSYESKTGNQIDGDAIRNLFQTAEDFDNATNAIMYVSAGSSADDAFERVFPLDEWAKLPGADWRTFVKNSRFVATAPRMLGAFLQNDKDAKLSEILELTGVEYWGGDGQAILKSLIQERADGDAVQVLSTMAQLSPWEFSEDIRPSIIAKTDYVDAVTGELIPLDSVGYGVSDWFDEVMGSSIPGKQNLGEMSFPTTNEIGEMKEQTANNVAGDDVSYEHANAFVRQWAASSNDNDLQSLSIQDAARQELGTVLSEWQKERFSSVRIAFPDAKPMFADQMPEADADRLTRQLVRRVYDQTQAELQKRGIRSVVLYRGIELDDPNFKQGGKLSVHTNALSSWTTSKQTAVGFASGSENKRGYVLSTVVPAEWVYSTPMTGPGCLAEHEIIVVGKQEFQVRVER